MSKKNTPTRAEELAARVAELELEERHLDTLVPELKSAYLINQQPTSHHAPTPECLAANTAWSDAENRLSEVRYDLRELRKALAFYSAVESAEDTKAEAANEITSAAHRLAEIENKRQKCVSRLTAIENALAVDLAEIEDAERLAAEQLANAIADGDEQAVLACQAEVDRVQAEGRDVRARCAQNQDVIVALRNKQTRIESEMTATRESRDTAQKAVATAEANRLKAEWDTLVDRMEATGRAIVRAVNQSGDGYYHIFSRFEVPRFAPGKASLSATSLVRDSVQ